MKLTDREIAEIAMSIGNKPLEMGGLQLRAPIQMEAGKASIEMDRMNAIVESHTGISTKTGKNISKVIVEAKEEKTEKDLMESIRSRDEEAVRKSALAKKAKQLLSEGKRSEAEKIAEILRGEPKKVLKVDPKKNLTEEKSELRMLKTYQVVTPESSKEGAPSEEGEEFDKRFSSVEDIADAIRDDGSVEYSEAPIKAPFTGWFTTTDGVVDYDDGSETTYEFHPQGLSQEQWVELFKRLGSLVYGNPYKMVPGEFDEVEEAKELHPAEAHQKKIAIETVKNPSKELLGGMSASEAEMLLKKKFGMSEKEIEKLKEGCSKKASIKEAESAVGPEDFEKALADVYGAERALISLWKKSGSSKQVGRVHDHVMQALRMLQSFKKTGLKESALMNQRKDTPYDVSTEEGAKLFKEIRKFYDHRMVKAQVRWFDKHGGEGMVRLMQGPLKGSTVYVHGMALGGDLKGQGVSFEPKDGMDVSVELMVEPTWMQISKMKPAAKTEGCAPSVKKESILKDRAAFFEKCKKKA